MITQRSSPFYKKNSEIVENFYCTLVNYAYHIGKYYQHTQKYRFNNHLSSAFRMKCNKYIKELDTFMKNICQKKVMTIEFDLNNVREVEADF